MLKLELVGPDRPGIVLPRRPAFAERGVSIEDLHTEIVSKTEAEHHAFKVRALLVVPAFSLMTLCSMLETLASESMLDVALDEHGPI